MSATAGASASLELPAFLLGPKASGRSYSVLRAPADVGASAATLDRLNDLALSLHDWSRSGQAGFICFLPLDEAQGLWALLRGASLGESRLGSVARARGVVLNRPVLDALGWQAHRLAPSLGAPDAAAEPSGETLQLEVAKSANDPQLSASPEVQQLARTLAFRRRVIFADSDADAEAIAAAVLSSPVGRREPVSGWSAGGLLARNGRFDPAQAFRLIATSLPPASLAETLPEHVAARFHGRVLASAELPSPPSWQAWVALFEAKQTDRISGSGDTCNAELRWRNDFAELTPEDVVRRLVGEAVAGLAPLEQVNVLHRLALVSGQMADATLAHAARFGLARAFGDLFSPDKAEATSQIDSYVRIVQPHLGDVLAGLPARLALDTGVLENLHEDTIAALTDQGIAGVRRVSAASIAASCPPVSTPPRVKNASSGSNMPP